jgi:hypothetical protein
VKDKKNFLQEVKIATDVENFSDVSVYFEIPRGQDCQMVYFLYQKSQFGYLGGGPGNGKYWYGL